MTTEVLTQALTAGQTAFMGQGRVWYLKTATTAITITLRKNGSSAYVRNFINVPAGFKFKADPGDGWDIMELLSGANQTIEMVLSDDDVDASNAITIIGVATTTQQPFTTVTSTGPTVIANANKLSIAANLGRKKIEISNLSTSTGSVFVQTAAAGAGFGIELQPGMSWAEWFTGAVDLRNDSGGNCTVSYNEYA